MVEILLPTLDAPVDADGDVALLADSAAEAAGLKIRGQVRQRVRQVVELAAVEELGGHVLLEPQDLGDLHLHAHLAADVAQQVVFCVVDLDGLVERSVVQPEDHIAVVAIVLEFRPCYRDGLVGVVSENSEGARGVKADALDRGRVDLGLL